MKKTTAATAPRENAAKKQQKKRRLLTILIGALCLLLLGGALLGAWLYDKANTPGAKLRRQTALQSENFKIDGAMMSYYVSRYYANLQQTLGDDFKTQTGIDPQKALRTQQIGQKTACEIILDGARAQAEQTLLYAEGAKENGVSIPEDAKQNMLAAAQTVTSLPNGVIAEDVARVLELNYLAQSYSDTLEQKQFTDDEIEANASVLRGGAYAADLYGYAFFYTTGNVESIAAARDRAAALAQVPKGESFAEHLQSTIMQTEGANAEKAAQTVKKALFTGVLDDGGALGDFLFSGTAKAGDTTVIEDKENGAYRVYAVEKAPYLPLDETVSIHEVLFPLSVFQTEKTCREKAQAFLDAFEKTDGSAAEFASLAANNNFTGDALDGLQSDVRRTDLSAAVGDFAFSSDRASGDTTLLYDKDRGASVLYYIGQGKPYYYALSRAALRSQAKTKAVSELASAHTVTVDSAVLLALPIA